jgi:hypothetical protein
MPFASLLLDITAHLLPKGFGAQAPASLHGLELFVEFNDKEEPLKKDFDNTSYECMIHTFV